MFKVIDGKLVNVPEESTNEPIKRDEPNELEGLIESDENELERQRAAEEESEESEEPEAKPKPEPRECSKCHGWFMHSPGLPEDKCGKCYEATRPKSTNGTAFDNHVADEIGSLNESVYSPTVEQFREIFNQEVEGHGILPDNEFISEVLNRKFIKAAKDCTIDELVDRVERYEKFMFELWPAKQGAKIELGRRSKLATKEQAEKIAALDKNYKSPAKVKEAADKRTKTKKVVNAKTAIEGVLALYGDKLKAAGMSEEQVRIALRVQFPSLFE